MSFASIPFFLFLPLVVLLHYARPGRRWQNGVLVAASYFFYGWWDYRFCLLMLGSSLVDYYAGLWIAREGDAARRRRVLVVALGANLVALGFFKYYNFFADSLAVLAAAAGLPLDALTLNILLPAGISFYTFQTMSYTIDIYRGAFQPRRELGEYLAFVSFFPQLVAGPIERATQLLPQFQQPRTFSPNAARAGARLILWGLAKKMVLADNLGALVQNAYTAPGSVTAADLAVATFAFAFQIYCDFSAYSDIAVGSAQLFGIRLTRNFACPYFAQSLSEFWRRWHISLSSWLRDYVFIPLGGSRVPPPRIARNLLLTALVSGLWHGAAWQFVLWGALHGGVLVAEHFLRPGRNRSAPPHTPGGEGLVPTFPTLLRMGFTFLLVCAAWVLFRADTLGDATMIWARVAGSLFTFDFYAGLAHALAQHRLTFIPLAIFIGLEWITRTHDHAPAALRGPVLVRWAAYTLLFWTIVVLGTRRTEDFIYFRF
jgi:D-alanyl-lipoteichoic acid acyltransferase DltB (MBOAT superfamily)